MMMIQIQDNMILSLGTGRLYGETARICNARALPRPPVGARGDIVVHGHLHISPRAGRFLGAVQQEPEKLRCPPPAPRRSCQGTGMRSLRRCAAETPAKSQLETSFSQGGADLEGRGAGTVISVGRNPCPRPAS
jgi:hypothetical protein